MYRKGEKLYWAIVGNNQKIAKLMDKATNPVEGDFVYYNAMFTSFLAKCFADLWIMSDEELDKAINGKGPTWKKEPIKRK